MLSNILKERRSHYTLGESKLKSFDLIPMMTTALETSPTTFNNQSGRIVLLLDSKHRKFWDIAEKLILKKAPKEKHYGITKRFQSIRNSQGTVLFYKDNSVINKLKGQHYIKSYVDKVDGWIDQEQGMLQLSVWLQLTERGLGANLLHYNPLVDEEVAKQFKINKNWELVGQMTFGTIITPPKDKQQIEISERFRVEE